VSPAEVTIAPGESVRFENQDEMPGGHTIVAENDAFASPGLAKGQVWEHTFTKPGVYVFKIKEHPSAVGKVIVGEPAPAAPAAK
jgi:plastocyanin